MNAGALQPKGRQQGRQSQLGQGKAGAGTWAWPGSGPGSCGGKDEKRGCFPSWGELPEAPWPRAPARPAPFLQTLS